MKELVGIILLTVLVVFGSCNSNTNVSHVGTSPQLFDVCQVSTGNPDYRNRELFINDLENKCKYHNRENRYNLLPIQDTRFTNFNPFKSRCKDYRLWQQ